MELASQVRNFDFNEIMVRTLKNIYGMICNQTFKVFISTKQ